MSRIRYLFLILLFLPSIPRAQDLFTLNSAPEAWRIHTLHQQAALSDILLSRYTNYEPDLPSSFYRTGFTVYQPFLNIPTRYSPLDTTRAKTFLHLMLGTKRDQLLFLDHHQRLGKYFTGGLHYHSIVSPGFLRNQLAKNKSFGAFLQMQMKRYTGTVEFNSSKVNASENGGITDTILASPPTRSELEVLPVRLSGAEVKTRVQEIRFDQSLNFTDSTHSFSINLRSSFNREGWSYRESLPVTDLYPIASDTNRTYDTTFINTLSVSPSLQYGFSIDSLTAIQLEAGSHLRFTEERITNRRQEPQWQEPFARLQIRHHQHLLNLNSTFAIGERFGGNFNLKGIYNFDRQVNFLSGFSIGVETVRSAAAATDQYYNSNHFVWDNAFSDEKYFRTSASLSILRNHLKAFWSRTTYTDKVILDASRMMRQLSNKRYVTETGLQAGTELGRWIFQLKGTYRPEIIAEIQEPESEIFFRISYGNRFFKNALNAEAGISGFITSGFYTPRYEPALGRYRSQYTEITGETPVFNVFVNLRIRTAVISVMMENALYGVVGDPYYSGPRNPAPPRMLRISIQWLLDN